MIHEESGHVYVFGDFGLMDVHYYRDIRDIVAPCGGRSVEDSTSNIFRAKAAVLSMLGQSLW